MSGPTAVYCPVAATIALIGGKYKPIILWNLFSGTKRYGELRRTVSDATPKMLTQQLRELETDGLIERKVYAVVPPKVEYSLTPLGKSLHGVMHTIFDWGTQYLESRGICPNCGMRREELGESEAA